MSSIRFSGLASGMDTESIVKQLMQIETSKVNKIKQQKEKLEWKRDSYRAVNTSLLSFRNTLTNMKLSTSYRVRTTTSSDEAKITATANSTAGIGSFNISQVKQLATSANRIGASISGASGKINLKDSLMTTFKDKDDSTKSKIDWKTGVVESTSVSVTADGTSFEMKLPTGAEVATSAANFANVKVGTKTFKVVKEGATLNAGEVSISTDGKLTFGETISKGSSISVNYVANQRQDTTTLAKGATTFSLSKGSIAKDGFSLEMKDGKSYKLSDSPEADGTYKLINGSDVLGTIDLTTGKVTLSKATEEESVSITTAYKQNYFTTSMSTQTSTGEKSETFLFDGTKTLSDVISAVNSSSLGVTMFFDEFSNKFTLNRTEQGNYGGKEVPQINFGSDAFFNDVLGFSTAKGATINNGQNAKITINGLETERTSNTFTLDGVTFTLKQVFNKDLTVEESLAASGQVTIGVKNDASKVVENIKKFVEEYNTLIKTLGDLTSEAVYRDYAPLTDEERENLSDKQQELWEQKAKSGLHRNDTILSSVLSSMRLNFSSPVSNSSFNSTFNQLAKIGIKTTANYLEGGKLEIDEAALLKAIEEDPAGVESLFNINGATESSQGIVQRLYETVNNTMKQITSRAGSSLSTNDTFAIGKELNTIQKRITSFEDRLESIEARYWKKFTAMEKAIQNANAQSTQLMSFFSSGS